MPSYRPALAHVASGVRPRRHVTIPLDAGTADYFRRLADDIDLPMTSLLLLVLRHLAQTNGRLSLTVTAGQPGQDEAGAAALTTD